MASLLGRVTAVAGALVSVRLDGGGRETVRAEIHSVVRIAAAHGTVFGTVRELRMQPEGPVAEVELVGEVPAPADTPAATSAATLADGAGPATFQRGVTRFPRLGDAVQAASDDDLQAIYRPSQDGQLRLGTLDEDGRLPASVKSEDLLAKHFAVLGSTGSGKSCAVAVLLRRILDTHPNGHVILLDPHNEYGTAFAGRAEVVSPDNISLPFWLLNFEEMVGLLCTPEPMARQQEADILKRAMLAAKQAYQGEGGAHAFTVDTPVPFRLTTLLQHIDRAMGQLAKAGDSLPYRRLKARIETLRDDRRFAFMFAGLTVQDTMAEIIARLLRVPVAGKPLTIVDLSAVPTEIVDTVVSLLARMIFDFAVWSDSESQVPVLLVCEEAHRYIPADGSDAFEPTRKALARIAKEGRKYGIALGLVTQRPSEMSETVLSQCGTLVAMRMSNDRDQEFVRRALPDGALALFNALPALATREAVVVGEGASVPMRMRFEALAPEVQPRKAAVTFADAWRGNSVGREAVARAVDRWRRQSRTYPAEDTEPPA